MTLPYCWRACPVITRREVWLPVPVPTRHRWGHRYEVSNEGRVRRVNPRTGQAVQLTTYEHPTGYLAVSLGGYRRGLRIEGQRVGGCHLVHALVARAFIGPPPRDGRVWEVDHLDFDRLCARVTGLRWLLKDTNAWRWKFWTDEQPPEDREIPPDPPEVLRAYAEAMRRNGWPEPAPSRPQDMHRHPVAS